MKLKEITKTIEEEALPGTYAGVRFGPDTVKALQKYGKSNGIPNRLPHENFHTTLLYSRKHLPNYQPAGDYPVPMKGTPVGFEVWPSQPDDDGNVKNCLVLAYSCPTLYQRHHKLMNQHGATYDFDEYKPHVTLSYDIGDFNADDLPPFEEELEIVSEYMEELKQSWADDKKEEK